MPDPSRWYEPFGESLSRLTVDSKTMSEFTLLNELVIRLSKVQQSSFFQLLTHRSIVLKQLAAVIGLTVSV